MTFAAELGVHPRVRPAARVISRDAGGWEGGCADGWVGVREAVTMAVETQQMLAAAQ